MACAGTRSMLKKLRQQLGQQAKASEGTDSSPPAPHDAMLRSTGPVTHQADCLPLTHKWCSQPYGTPAVMHHSSRLQTQGKTLRGAAQRRCDASDDESQEAMRCKEAAPGLLNGAPQHDDTDDVV